MYNDIYIYIYKGKKSTNRRLKKKKKKRDKVANQNGTVDEQCKNTVEKRVQIDDWEKKKLHIEQTKSTVAFTYSPNKCLNIFIKHLFSIVVGHSFIFYYFILTYKKLTPQ